MNATSFAELGLAPDLLRAVTDSGYTTPTPIQSQAIPVVLAGKDVMVWSVVFGMTVGILSAVWRNRWPDRLGMTLAVSGISFPAFALGMPHVLALRQLYHDREEVTGWLERST